MTRHRHISSYPTRRDTTKHTYTDQDGNTFTLTISTNPTLTNDGIIGALQTNFGTAATTLDRNTAIHMARILLQAAETAAEPTLTTEHHTTPPYASGGILPTPPSHVHITSRPLPPLAPLPLGPAPHTPPPPPPPTHPSHGLFQQTIGTWNAPYRDVNLDKQERALDKQERALQARRNRNTGPPPPRRTH